MTAPERPIVLVVINGVWNLLIKRFSSRSIQPNNIYSSIKAYMGKVLVVLDTIHSFRGGAIFNTLHANTVTCATVMLNKNIYIHVYYFFILQALSQQEYIMTNNNHYMCDITNVTGNHNSFRPITVIPKRKRTSTVLHKHTHTDRQT